MSGILNQCQEKTTTTTFDGGEEKPANFPVPAPELSPESSGKVREGMDYYTQTSKALSERSPFDSEEVLAKKSPTLPSGLASVLTKNLDSRKKHKRHHSETNSSRKGSGEKSKRSNIWTELEDYFRELTLPDIERLNRFSSSLASLESSDSCFLIPAVGNVARTDDNDNNSNTKVENCYGDDDSHVENVSSAENGAPVVVAVSDDVQVSDFGVVKLKGEDNEQQVENGSRDSSGVVEQGRVPEFTLQSCSSIEWVIGSRNRVYLESTRPTKKRKVQEDSAGLERLMVSQPCEGSSSLCHVCSMGDLSDQLNQLVVCKSCKVAVHQKCYGVQGWVEDFWVCSWCKWRSNSETSLSENDRPCVLCTKSGGALKRIQRAGGRNEGAREFAHLFCSQWMTSVYIDDTRLMEPILGVEGVEDPKGKSFCYLCKIKCGTCVRCNDGSCRTVFHPICAREARNKLEIWGKFGCDHIELRAFCAKHSEDSSVTDGGTAGTLENESKPDVGSDSLAISTQPGNKIKKLKIGCRNGDKVTYHIGSTDTNSGIQGDQNSLEMRLKDVNSNLKLETGSGDKQVSSNSEPSEGNLRDDLKTPLLDLGIILKKLLDRGKVSLEQIASETGIMEDYLAARVTNNHLGPELSRKILKWLKDHAHLNFAKKDSIAKLRRLMSSKVESGGVDSSDAVVLRDLDMSGVVPVKSVPPRRRTVGNISVVTEDEEPMWDNKLLGNFVSTNGETPQEHVNGHSDLLCKDSMPDGLVKSMVRNNGFEHHVEEPFHTSGSTALKSNSPCDIGCNGAEEGVSLGKSSLMELELPSCSPVNTAVYCDGNAKSGTDSFVHPYIQNKLEELQKWPVWRTRPELIGLRDLNSFTIGECSSVNVSCNINVDEDDHSNGLNLEDLQKIKDLGILELMPENDLEGEHLYFQHRLLHNSVCLKHRADQLVCKIARNLPIETEAVRRQRWDDVLVNQYVYELKEARKQGRKERRHKEAQAVLAAATAAAAASSRVSSLRKDTVDEPSQQENQLKLESSRTRGSLSSLSVPQSKESNLIFDRSPDLFQFTPGLPNEHLKSCDICRRPESLLNPILVCSGCKVPVHLNCYRSVKESTGPWYCELCEDSSSRASRSTSDKPSLMAECGLCGASNGGFRKSSNGEWVHAFCAEWVFDSTFRRGQVCSVAGMETVTKGNDVCAVCHSRFGVCIKCYYGNCQSTFHPSCARSAGYYMLARNVGGGKMQNKAYCSKHSLEQRAKVETQKHGAEDLKIVKQHRVELEKLRLLCERIVKREKLKRELVLCNHEIFTSRRDTTAFSRLIRRPFLSNEGSSESATTSLMASRSCSEAMQRSDDVTVDSALSSKRCIRLPLSIDNDQKTDDSSTSQRIPTPKPKDRASFAGKQIPIRAAMTGHNVSQSDMLKSRKNTDTFEKELVMTSDQASMRNRQLPKGYFYVPLDSLSNGKQVSPDSVDREEVDE